MTVPGSGGGRATVRSALSKTIFGVVDDAVQSCQHLVGHIPGSASSSAPGLLAGDQSLVLGVGKDNDGRSSVSGDRDGILCKRFILVLSENFCHVVAGSSLHDMNFPFPILGGMHELRRTSFQDYGSLPSTLLRLIL